MNRYIITVAALLAANTAIAGGLDRSRQDISVLFSEEDRAQFRLTHVSPDLSGTLGVGSGDILDSYAYFTAGFRLALNDKFSYALVIDQPYGAATSYPTGTGYPFAGSTADVDSLGITLLGRYQLGNGFSVHGGIKAQKVSSSVGVPPAGGYTLEGDDTWAAGWVAGAAYEIPEYRLRASLTYHSAVDHDQTVTESSVLGVNTTDISFEIPQSLELDLRTGINPKTLVFANIRWVEWSAFRATPPDYQTLTGTSLLRFLDDRTTYTIGAARRLTDEWVGIATVEHEPSTDEITTDLGPADGRTGIGLAARYEMDQVDIAFGARYLWIGDATTRNGASFSDNTALVLGMQIGLKL